MIIDDENGLAKTRSLIFIIYVDRYDSHLARIATMQNVRIINKYRDTRTWYLHQKD